MFTFINTYTVTTKQCFWSFIISILKKTAVQYYFRYISASMNELYNQTWAVDSGTVSLCCWGNTIKQNEAKVGQQIE